MRIDQTISLAISRLMGHLVRRIAAMAVLALFALAAIYHLTVAGTLALEGLYGPLYARLIVFGTYLALVLMVFGYLYATRAKTPASTQRSKLSQDERMATMLEAILLGYTAAKGNRAIPKNGRMRAH